MAEIIDGELEDDQPSSSSTPRSALTQNFPFAGAPPTASPNELARARQSPALDMMIEAVESTYSSFTVAEQYSLRKIVRNITGTFTTCFSDWSVGVGIEEQLSSIRQLVGLSPLTAPYGRSYLDYTAMVKPSVITSTLTAHSYTHNEDFFFRSVHLGTECWAFVALRRLESAKEQLGRFGHWRNAAAHITSASHILAYLGDHIMMLTSMVRLGPPSSLFLFSSFPLSSSYPLPSFLSLIPFFSLLTHLIFIHLFMPFLYSLSRFFSFSFFSLFSLSSLSSLSFLSSLSLLRSSATTCT